MTNEMKQVFTRRLSQCNRAEMIVITYDIFFEYLKNAREMLEDNRMEEFKEDIRKCQKTIGRLEETLNYKYDLSKQLEKLYAYVKIKLSQAMYSRKIENLDECKKVMIPLYNAFGQVAKQDTSNPIMTNTQRIYAGMTYGRGILNENCIENTSRGFLV